jgi:hypothetical protein
VKVNPGKPATPFIGGTAIEGLIIGIAGVGFGIIASQFIGDERGQVAGLAACATGLLIVMAWPLRKKPWFWGTVAAFSAAHALAVLRINWAFTERLRGQAFASLIYPDSVVMLGIVYALYRLIYGKPVTVIEELPDEPRYSQRDINL